MWSCFCWVSTRGDQSLMVGCPYLPFSTSFLWQSLSLKLEFTVVWSAAGQAAPGISLSTFPPHQCWGHRHIPPLLVSYVVPGIGTQAIVLVQKYFIHWDVSQARGFSLAVRISSLGAEINWGSHLVEIIECLSLTLFVLLSPNLSHKQGSCSVICLHLPDSLFLFLSFSFSFF